MKNIIYAMDDLFKNSFRWQGRLSREGYGWAWAGILAVNAGLFSIRKAALFLTLFSRYSYGKQISQTLAYAIALWNAAAFFPLLSATMRRYHDSGKAGWKAILFNGLGVVFIVLGTLVGSLTIIGFVFSGGYMVTADADIAMARLLWFGFFSILLLLAGTGFAVLNLKCVLCQSDPGENAYGKPAPFPPG
ncbi:DUF805 domain-containing protein [Clostridiaceae bacterium]|nr:DUF805 domain-containing protein [Clostridiaceae bacterium]RKI10564.1 DUF805 domain-containing protein [bacterium 1XD21-70]